MTMKAIDLKMLRDLKGMWGQALAIAFIMLSGIATFVTMMSTMDSLQRTLSQYYEEFRFADVFASLNRAPALLNDQLREVRGIAHVQTRVVAAVNLEITGFEEPVTGQIYSVPPDKQPALNGLFLREGRLIRAGREQEVLLNEAFAEAHDLHAGDQLTAIINGRRKTLDVVGIALSPEHLMQIQPGSVFPDPQRFGVLWMGRPALAAAYDMEGAFNNATFTLAPGASVEEVTEHLERILKPYGSQGVIPRKDQPSNFYIHEEFRQLQSMATVLPLIFLGVAAFMLNILISRLIGTQREQIAILKAFGYSNLVVGWHYAKLVLVIAMVGAISGTLLGAWFGRGMGEMYMEFYRFPYLNTTLRFPTVFTAVALTTGASLFGIWYSVRQAVNLPPAEAMRPAPPATYRPTLLERLGLKRFFDQPTRMIARNLERQWLKSVLTITGISSAFAILVMGFFFGDAFSHMIGIQYGLADRANLTVSFNQPTSTDALYEIQALPGVHFAEPFRAAPVRLHFGHRTYETAINGIPADPYLRRVLNKDLEVVTIPRGGLVFTDRLAAKLDVTPGQEVSVELMEGSRRTVSVPVASLAQQYIGMGAYMAMEDLNRYSGNGQAISGVLLQIDARYEEQLTRALQRRPRVASIVSQDRVIESFYETSGQTMLTFAFILTLFAGGIAFGVVYNSARIALAERDRELASLRVLGFTRNEIAYILIGEQALLTLLSLPLGAVLGTLMSTLFVKSLENDLFEFPVVLYRDTFAYAALVVLVASVISAGIVYRKLRTLDLIGVLKTRE